MSASHRPHAIATLQRHWRLRPIALALACASGAAGAVTFPINPLNSPNPGAAGFPQVGHPVMGTISGWSLNGTTMVIDQASPRAVINWNAFSLDQGNTLRFNQPGVTSVTLNRVVNNGPQSKIDGSITAPGRVFIINPAGVLFGKTAQVNVGGLVASTLDLTGDTEKERNDTFMAGGDAFEFAVQPTAKVAGPVGNAGRIETTSGGTVVLIGGTVTNSSGASIVTPGGTAALASADRVVLDIGGDGLTKIELPNAATRSKLIDASEVSNYGRIEAQGGRIVLKTQGTEGKDLGIRNQQAGTLVADSMASRNGEIVLDSGASFSGVSLVGGTVQARGDVAGTTGGTIQLRGETVLLGTYTPDLDVPIRSGSRIDASGQAGGGSIRVEATARAGESSAGAVAVSAETKLSADALNQGNGGSVRLLGERTLRAYGALSARGGPNGGDGGFIETSGGYKVPAEDAGNADLRGGFDVSGVSVDAKAPSGKAGTWLIDPYDVTISHGEGPGTLPENPFVPVGTSTVQDGDINAALVNGNVTITTGTGGDPTQGDVFFDDALINYAGAGERTFTVDAHRSVRANAGTIIGSSGGPLNVVFNADANGGGATTGGGQISYSGDIYTNGGNVTMNAAWANLSNEASVALDGQVIDTRRGNAPVVNPDLTLIGYTGGTDAQAGGNVSIVGRTNAPSVGDISIDGVNVNGTSIRTSTGNIDIVGTTVNGSGVIIQALAGEGGLFSTSGNITVTGVGGFSPSSAYSSGYGVLVSAPDFNAAGQPRISSVDGNIAVRGLRQAGADNKAGVRVGGNARITTTGQGDIEITGEAQGNGAGVQLAPTFSDTFGTQQGGVVSAARNLVLRAANDGSADALVIGEGSQANAGLVMNLRPGGLDLSGPIDAYVATPTDRIANAIALGGAAATGFAVSADELTRITAPTLVFGSNTHAADITQTGALNMASALTLQNGGGGNIALTAPINAPALGLISAGNITQTAGAAITAGSLLALSTGGSVLLDQAANNVSANTLGGGAAGAFRYQDVDALRVGNVSVTGYDAAGSQPQTVTTGSMAADTVFVRTLADDLTLATDVSSTSGTDLVAAARFQNAGSYTLGGAPWRIWADTWAGESRGGVAGSGPLPNLYHCAYLGVCTVTVSPGDNHFIYAQQPSATITIGNTARLQGQPNPAFSYGVSGLILGDTPAGFSGSMSTGANEQSPAGLYSIDGTFASAAGYAVTVVPGVLTVTEASPVPPPLFVLPQPGPPPDLVLDMPNTYTFDSNIGAPPICFAAGPLGGDRAQQGDDVLAREWSRVRARPKLTNCLDTERKDGCGDF